MIKILNTWQFNLILYLILYVVFTQAYKVVTKKNKNDGALTILLQFLGGIFVLLFIPFFEIKFPTDIKVWAFLGLAVIFYAIADRVNTTARKGLEVSVYSLLNQLATVFIIVWGIIFLKEPILLNKLLGALLIILGNILVLYKKGKFEWNKYILFSILGNLSISFALFIDVGTSESFNLPIYVALTLIIPGLLILIFERIKVKDIILEFKNGNKKAITAITLSWGTMIVAILRAYTLSNVTTIASLSATTTILNVFVAYFFLKEKDSLFKKIIAAIIVVLGIVLINI